ncbi:MAG TPA: prepilin-type N-terminal cleavage/methylation domain-containing protein [Gemmatimonadaceae bacterium]|nr:prepilin-type N-terminal cleavage/methylation domain-containing protein [Gemmatimonadaceae bacterium]
MFNRRSSRVGFTLPEVLVTVAIVAILAAVVVPAVTNQISKGETGSVASAVTSYATGVTAFVTDVRRYPGALSQLTNKIATSEKDVTGRVYGNSEVAQWKGPYTSTVTFTANDSIPIGLNAFAVDSLRDTTIGGRAFTSMYIATSDTAVANKLDVLFDRGDGATNGSLRFTVGGASPNDTVVNRRVQYLLTPH